MVDRGQADGRTYEALGAERARIETFNQVHSEYSERATIKEQYGAGLRKQIETRRTPW